MKSIGKLVCVTLMFAAMPVGLVLGSLYFGLLAGIGAAAHLLDWKA